MSKKKVQLKENFDDELYAQMDFLRADYDKSQTVIEEQKSDILKLIALLIENDIPVSNELLKRYVRRAPDNTDEDLPFD